MPPLHRLSASEQVAAHLRDELTRGKWKGKMPGQIRLAKELGVSRNTAEAALRQLEAEGLLVGQGPGRRRLITQPDSVSPRPLRVAILLHERTSEKQGYMIELLHALAKAGHTIIIAQNTLIDMGMDVGRVSRMVEQTEADAWVVCAGSREVLEWFSAQPTPCVALFGRKGGLPIAAAGPNKPPVIAEITRNLIGIGHTRIVHICRKLRRLPEPGQSERAFLKELADHGLPAGSFNLPDWTETRSGFQALLGSLFRVTPPTALLIDEAPFAVATMQFLLGRRLRIPENVSLICTDADPAFAWCEPPIAHIRWDALPVVRIIVRWAAAVGRGESDVRQTTVPAEFFPGGTIGPAPSD